MNCESSISLFCKNYWNISQRFTKKLKRMKKLTTLLFFILLALTCISQNENFIQVTGFSDTIIKAESIRITVQLTEVQRDEFNKIREKSIDEILVDLGANLKSVGYSIDDAIEIWPPEKQYNYKQQETVRYFLFVKKIEEAKKISALQIKGLIFQEFKYFYPESMEIDDHNLSKKALEDAAQKADFLAQKAGKKIGKIINITDQFGSRSTYNNRYSHSVGETFTFSYNLTVTYELLD